MLDKVVNRSLQAFLNNVARMLLLYFLIFTLEMFSTNYNLGQGIVDKFTKLSKIGFSMECLRADFSQFSCANIEICLLSGYSPSNSNVSRISSTCEATRTFTSG